MIVNNVFARFVVSSSRLIFNANKKTIFNHTRCFSQIGNTKGTDSKNTTNVKSAKVSDVGVKGNVKTANTKGENVDAKKKIESSAKDNVTETTPKGNNNNNNKNTNTNNITSNNNNNNNNNTNPQNVSKNFTDEELEKGDELLQEYLAYSENRKSKLTDPQSPEAKKLDAAILRVTHALSVISHKKGDIDRCINLLEKCIEFVKSKTPINYNQLWVFGHELSATYMNDEKLEDSLEILEDVCLVAAQKLGNTSREFSVFASIAKAFTKNRKFEESITHYINAIKFAHKHSLREGEWRMLEEVGSVWGELSNWKEAVNSHKTAKEIAKVLNDKKRECISTMKLGYALSQCERDSDARVSVLEALHIARELKDSRAEAQVYLTLGRIYFNLNDFDKAIPHLTSGVRLSLLARDRNALTLLSSLLAEAYIITKDFNKAKNTLKTIILYIEKTRKENETEEEGEDASLRVAFGALARIALNNKEYDEALIYLEECKQIDEYTQDPVSLSTTYFMLSSLYKAQGKDQEASEAYTNALIYSTKLEKVVRKDGKE